MQRLPEQMSFPTESGEKLMAGALEETSDEVAGAALAGRVTATVLRTMAPAAAKPRRTDFLRERQAGEVFI
jgi:hypothetical protein